QAQIIQRLDRGRPLVSNERFRRRWTNAHQHSDEHVLPFRRRVRSRILSAVGFGHGAARRCIGRLTSSAPHLRSLPCRDLIRSRQLVPMTNFTRGTSASVGLLLVFAACSGSTNTPFTGTDVDGGAGAGTGGQVGSSGAD